MKEALNMKPREHKYRAWHPELKRFIYFTPLQLRWDKPDGGYHLTGFQEINELFHCFKSEDVKIQQFIGMKDANDTDIYEGDILQGFGWYFEIKYGNIVRTLLSPDGTHSQVEIPCFYFQRIGTDHKLFPIVHNDFGQHDLETLKIVGNIFENPNLI